MPIITAIDKPVLNSDKPNQSQVDARARAMAAFARTAGGAGHPEQLNQNALSAEDLSAIKAKESPTEGQTDKIDAASDKASAPEKDAEEPLSPQFAILARKEKAFRAKVQAQEQAVKAKEAALEARETALKAKESTYESDFISKDKLKPENVWATLQEQGLTYDQLTEMALNQPQETPAQRAAYQRLQDQIQRLEDAQKQTESNAQEQQTKAYQQAVAQIKHDAEKLVEADAAKYEAIKESGTVAEVVSLIERTFKEEGTLLTVEEAADMVEEYLVDQATKYAQFTKVKKRLEANAKLAAPKQEAAGAETSKSTTTKTLDNTMGGARKLSNRERALAAFRGEKL